MGSDGSLSTTLREWGDDMQTWQMFVTICAGIITVITLLDKLGVTKQVKQFNKNSQELEDIANAVGEVKGVVDRMGESQELQRAALLALIRNSLYRSFRENREYGVWTDDEATVQTRLHEAYLALGGNGEESLWWSKKTTWEIVSHEEYKRIVNEERAKNNA